MIRLTETDSGKIIRVEGAAAEVMLFYCFWQSALWPKWAEFLNRENLDGESKDLIKQVETVVESINNGREVLLWDPENSHFQKARQVATLSCRNVGIEVVLNGLTE